jgi:hypothetical protein
VAELCGYDPNSDKDDGVFWMQLQSFEKLYDCIMILRLPKIEGQNLHAQAEGYEEVGCWAWHGCWAGRGCAAPAPGAAA